MASRGLLSFVLMATLAPAAEALGTAFTYQGRLMDGSAPATGVYDLEFRLFDSAGGPTQVGSTLEIGDVSVTSGLFNVTLDFGAAAFNGNDRWLQIGVRPGASSGAYTTLAPRQSLTPAPNALYATSSGGAETAKTVAGLTCSNGQALLWSGSAWSCGSAVSSVGTGAGLTGGPITSAGTIAVASGGISSAMIASGAVGSAQINNTQVQARITTPCPTGSSIKAVNADGSTQCDSHVSTPMPGFSRTSADTGGGVGRHGSITIGADGLGVIAYRDDTNGDLKVAHCIDVACGSVTTAIVDGAGDVGTHTSIAIGADGLPLISYRDVATGDLKTAHCNDASCSSATTATIDSTGDVGFDTSLAIGTDGLGLISYWDNTNGDLKVAHCSNTACSTATISMIDTVNTTGQHTSLAIGTDGLGLISYLYATGDALKVAHCSNVLCTSATLSTLDPEGGSYTSLAIGADGLGLISYGAISVGHIDLKTAHCNDMACTSATLTTLETVGFPGFYTSLEMGGDGLGLISHRVDTGGDLAVTHCSNVACTSATTVVVDGPADVGTFSSLAIGVDGLGLISYHDATNADLKVVHCSNAQCVPFVDRPVVPLVGVTSVTAGSGLTGGTLTSGGTLAVDFTGSSGAATSVARSDHNHYGQAWSGAAGTALQLTTTATSGTALVATSTGANGTGVLGATETAGGIGVYGINSSPGGLAYGVYGSVASGAGYAGFFNGRASVVRDFTVGDWVGINLPPATAPAAHLDINVNNYRFQVRDEGGLTPGINLGGTGSNVGVLRLRRKLEIWPDDAAANAGALDVRNTTGAATITLNGATGTVSKLGGSFKIDHPLDPLNKYLYHSFVESPDMKNIYDGVVTTDESGLAVVEFPDWFEALNRDFRYQLTVIGDGAWARARVLRKIDCGRFTIQTDQPRVEVSWQVTGIRKDAFAEQHRIPVEEDKPAAERGTLLYPAATKR